MANMTLAIPDDLKRQMDSRPELNWSEVARQAFAQKLKDMELFDKFTEKSTLTEKDAKKLGRELNKKMAKRYDA
jgi:hypothetical protein